MTPVVEVRRAAIGDDLGVLPFAPKVGSNEPTVWYRMTLSLGPARLPRCLGRDQLAVGLQSVAAQRIAGIDGRDHLAAHPKQRG
jgi:hypothetical protein